VTVGYSIDSDIVVFQTSGEYGPDELRATLRAALADPALPAKPLILVDIRGSISIQKRSASEIAETARFVAALSAQFGPRLALVVDSDVAYGLMRIAAVHAAQGGVDIQVFREFEPARAWLQGPSGAPPATG
jgi:hypothetical protein